MKNYQFLYILCFCLVSLSYGCEKAELQKSSTIDNHKITERWVEECGDCPNVDDCCGRIQLISGEYIEFETCGTTDGDAATCSDDIDGCLEIDGLINSFIKIFEEDRLLFCMEENHSFILKVIDIPIGGVVINITCQVGSISPQSINVPITAIGTYVFSVNGDCEIEQCYP